MTSPKPGDEKEQVSEDNRTTSEDGASTSDQTVANTAAKSTEEKYSIQPKFTSERWRDGIYSMETSTLTHTLFISEGELLSEDQKRERLAYAVFFKAQLEYEKKERAIFEQDFKKIQASFKAREDGIKEMERPDQDDSGDVDEGEARGSEADGSVFKKPLPPGRRPESHEKPKKGSGKKGSGSKDSSSSESGPKVKKGSGSKDSSGSESGTKSTRVKKSSSSSSEADTPGPKTRSSSRKKR